MSDNERAIQLFTTALASAKGDERRAQILHQRSAAHARQGAWEASLRDAQQAVELRPDWAKARCRAGAAHYGLDQLDAAAAAYEEALRLCDSGDAELADCARAALNDVRAKQARLATDAQLSPHVLGFAQSKTAGAKLLAQGRYAEAEQEYEGALRAMRAALQELPAEASGGMRATMEALERGMREELAAAKKRAAGSE